MKSTENIIGWNKFSDMVKALNNSCNWLIIRNYENLNDNFIFSEGEDIDILCSNFKLFIKSIKAKKRKGGRCSYEVLINNQVVPLDIRYVGDKYFDPLWARDMLINKQYVNKIPVLSVKDYFFSLIYHIKLQKFNVKSEYIPRLNLLAKKNNFLNLDHNFIYDDLKCSQLLNSFFEYNNYTYTYTDDARRNESFLKLIERIELNDLLENWRVLIKSLIKTLIKKFFNKIQLKKS